MQKISNILGDTGAFVDESSDEFQFKKGPNLDEDMTTLKFCRCFVVFFIELHIDFRSVWVLKAIAVK